MPNNRGLLNLVILNDAVDVHGIRSEETGENTL